MHVVSLYLLPGHCYCYCWLQATAPSLDSSFPYYEEHWRRGVASVVSIPNTKQMKNNEDPASEATARSLATVPIGRKRPRTNTTPQRRATSTPATAGRGQKYVGSHKIAWPGSEPRGQAPAWKLLKLEREGPPPPRTSLCSNTLRLQMRRNPRL